MKPAVIQRISYEMVPPSVRLIDGDRVDEDGRNYDAGVTDDCDHGMVNVAIYRAMIGAAPAAQRVLVDSTKFEQDDYRKCLVNLGYPVNLIDKIMDGHS